MEYYYKAGSTTGKKFLLLHGTGGDETSLVPIAEFLDESASILAFRGQVQEAGMNRFFKRDGLNQFDYESLEKESEHLLAEIKKISREKTISLADWILIGYSNGANIAAHILLSKKTDFQQAIFFHPMSLGSYQESFSLTDKKLWLSYGDHDPIVAPAEFTKLVTDFKKRGAELTLEKTQEGHQLTLAEIKKAKQWLN